MNALRARSAKRERLMIVRRRLVDRLLTERPACEAMLPGCTGRATELHDLLSRARGGSPVDPANQACVCSECHRAITEHRAGTEGWRHTRHGTP